MTAPSRSCRSANHHWRWSQAGDDGGCSLRPASPRIERHAPDNPPRRADPQPGPRPIGNLERSAHRRPPRSRGQPVTSKSP
jgi:hypothetical protein